MKVKIAVSEKVWSDHRVEQIVGNLLRFGVTLAAMIVLIGGSLYLIRYGGALPQYNGFQGEPDDLRSISGVVADALSFRSRGMIQLGLLLLIATPVARVAFLAFAFVRQRDRIYALMALILLVLLLYGLAAAP